MAYNSNIKRGILNESFHQARTEYNCDGIAIINHELDKISLSKFNRTLVENKLMQCLGIKRNQWYFSDYCASDKSRTRLCMNCKESIIKIGRSLTESRKG